MEQRILRRDRSTPMNRWKSAIFADWHNLEAWNVRIDMWPQLWVAIPAFCAADCEGTPLLRVMTPWIFTCFKTWIQEILEN